MDVFEVVSVELEDVIFDDYLKSFLGWSFSVDFLGQEFEGLEELREFHEVAPRRCGEV